MAVQDVGSDFESFFRSIRRWLHREAYKVCGDWHEADDLVQVALWRIYRRWEHLDRHREMGAYARRVVVRSFLTEHGRPWWRHEVVTLIASDAVVVGMHAVIDDRAILIPALRRLSRRQREVLAMRFLGDLSVDQTAQVLGCTAGTVTSQTTRALKALRRDLQNRAMSHMQCMPSDATCTQ